MGYLGNNIHFPCRHSKSDHSLLQSCLSILVLSFYFFNVIQVENKDNIWFAVVYDNEFLSFYVFFFLSPIDNKLYGWSFFYSISFFISLLIIFLCKWGWVQVSTQTSWGISTRFFYLVYLMHCHFLCHGHVMTYLFKREMLFYLCVV